MRKLLILILVILGINVAFGGGVISGVDISPKYSTFYDDYGNITKISIIPKYKYIRLQPGDSEIITVKLKNKNNKEVKITPKVVTLPYSEDEIDESWVSFDKTGFILKPNSSETIKITIKVPKDVEKGFYSGMIVFTEDKTQMPYGMPMYVNSFMLSLDVWIPPSVYIYPKYIYDDVEPGKTITYNITIKNLGNKTFTINPKIDNQDFFAYGEKPVMQLDKSMVEIEAPKTIPPKSEEIVKIKIKVPENAKGSIHGTINLGINDPGLDDFQQSIDINLRVYSKPKEPFVKEILINNASKLTIKVKASSYSWKYNNKMRDVDANVVIESPKGVLNIKPSKVTENFNVYISDWKLPPWEMDSEGIYNIGEYSKTKEYIIENPVNGIWKVKILPNCESFNVEIEIEQ
ncbi:conserved hypothetical protein [Methanocaldococcus sp. FS406-22]|uniref:COG1470 family protein n=1 Tax=Methanocaldococcus sp. (strain FS406-22) TaxID=644281 RepID=UPI0001BF47AE|nr:Fn3-like domain-containing protein [Methanocaldococcus sp. FS406-22]ADC69692.1 conserved hypothetical protein [Methanocaldococcus sp. FS406-22]